MQRFEGKLPKLRKNIEKERKTKEILQEKMKNNGEEKMLPLSTKSFRGSTFQILLSNNVKIKCLTKSFNDNENRFLFNN